MLVSLIEKPTSDTQVSVIHHKIHMLDMMNDQQRYTTITFVIHVDKSAIVRSPTGNNTMHSSNKVAEKSCTCKIAL